MNNLDRGYQAHFQKVGSDAWAGIMEKFEDGNIFQTAAYGIETWGANNIEHFLLTYEDEIVAATQVWIKRIPFIKNAIIHISYGPMWTIKGKQPDIMVLRNALRALYNEYVGRRNCLLRIRPNIIEGLNAPDLGTWIGVFDQENLKIKQNEYRYRTIKLDLRDDLAEIHRNFRKNWRRYLRKAEMNSLEVLVTGEKNYFQEFQKLYEEMIDRKNVSEYVEDIYSWIDINENLSGSQKLKLFLAKSGNDIVSGIVISIIGDTALGLMSASSSKDHENKYYSSYLLDWEIIKYLKSVGCTYYDLRGYSPETYPGPSYYKAGVGGDDVRFIGVYEAFRSPAISLICETGKRVDRFFTGFNALQLGYRRKVLHITGMMSRGLMHRLHKLWPVSVRFPQVARKKRIA